MDRMIAETFLEFGDDLRQAYDTANEWFAVRKPVTEIPGPLGTGGDD
jgi:hypothetical protein